MGEDMLVLWDWENTAKGVREKSYRPADYDLSIGFERVKEWWAGIGKVTKVEIFSPMHEIYGLDAVFHGQGFSIELCPKKPHDTTDAKLIQQGEWLLEYVPSMRFLCLGSGDKHFAPLLEKAKGRGIRIAVIIGNEMSLSWEIDRLIDNHPVTGKKMLHLFAPTRTPPADSG